MEQEAKGQNIFKTVKNFILFGLVFCMTFAAYQFYQKYVYENKILKAMVARLEADSRIAEVLVTDVQFNPITQKHMTTIKFLEYDSQGRPLQPRYFTFQGNIIQFQSLVVRFDDIHIEQADALRGKSAYLFWKAFILDGKNTQEYEIAKVNAVPEGYKIDGPRNFFEDEIWQRFWAYALDPRQSGKKGIKNAQIEAPGTKFVPGVLYTIRIEHDGGIRIDPAKIPEILKGEKL